jgi:glycosyltransferase involved in cell wall biosynthesis
MTNWRGEAVAGADGSSGRSSRSDVESRRRPLRIGYVIGQLTRGGSECQLYELLRGLDQRRFRGVVYCLSDDTRPYGDLISAVGVTVRAIPRRRRFDLQRLFTLAALLRRDRIDVVHSFLPQANGYAWPAQRLAGVPSLITSARNCQPAGRFRDWVNRQALRASAAILCNANASRDFVLAHYAAPAAKCSVIHNGVDLARFRPVPRGPRPGAGSPGHVLTVARLVPVKDLELFLEAAALVVRARTGARFSIIGDGPCRPQLERLAARLGLDATLSFLGERADVPDLLTTADVFWLTSASEGFPNVLLEALACGVPVVTRDVGGAREIVRNGRNGYLVGVRDPAQFASRTLELLAHPARARAMGLAGRQHIEQTFSVAAMVGATERLYETVATRLHHDGQRELSTSR